MRTRPVGRSPRPTLIISHFFARGNALEDNFADTATVCGDRIFSYQSFDRMAKSSRWDYRPSERPQQRSIQRDNITVDETPTAFRLLLYSRHWSARFVHFPCRNGFSYISLVRTCVRGVCAARCSTRSLLTDVSRTCDLMRSYFLL